MPESRLNTRLALRPRRGHGLADAGQRVGLGRALGSLLGEALGLGEEPGRTVGVGRDQSTGDGCQHLSLPELVGDGTGNGLGLGLSEGPGRVAGVGGRDLAERSARSGSVAASARAMLLRAESSAILWESAMWPTSARIGAARSASVAASAWAMLTSASALGPSLFMERAIRSALARSRTA
jgi:hypothetical protein